MEISSEKEYVSTRNACKLCSPLGASIAFKGIEGCVPLIHGSQGCATYIRRYLISHYKEPVDIASTNFSEDSAVFGGEKNLFSAIDNITLQYRPQIIAVATTCLSETIGDDMHQLISKYKLMHQGDTALPELVHVKTPSFKGTHADAFHNATLALVREYASFKNSSPKINLFPGFLSPADLRWLKSLVAEMGLECIVLPDYSETLDNEYTGSYERIPSGGTSLSALKESGSSRASLELGYILNRGRSQCLSPAKFLENTFSIPGMNVGIPIGITETDAFFAALEKLGGTIPLSYSMERGRLVDAYVDGHKYVFGKRAVVYGEEDFALALTGFLEEIGMEVVLCASGGESGLLKSMVEEKTERGDQIKVLENADFEDIAKHCRETKPDILIGNSKGYYIARELGIPLVRTGFPIHDRLGGQRIRNIGYSGTLQLFDRIANALIEHMQEHSPVGYKYM